MPGLPLSPELCNRITQALSMRSRRGDLAALCATCKTFQREAETLLYDSMIMTDPQKAHLACRTIIQNERLALLVHSFWFSQESRRPPPLGQPFWAAVQGALKRMHNLEYLFLYDTTFSNSWILDPTQIKFQLQEAKLRFVWDEHLLRFLESQRKLHTLQTLVDILDDPPRQALQPGSLPVLRSFDGMFMVAMQLLSCPLVHLQVAVDMEYLPLILEQLPKLSRLNKTLRGLSVLDLPEEYTYRALSVITTACPTLRHIGMLALPPTNRHKFHQSLTRMHHLRSLQLEVSRWVPQPALAAQRALAAEIKVYCPTIRYVVFWIQTTRFRWTFNHEWISQIDVHQYAQFDPTWCSV